MFNKIYLKRNNLRKRCYSIIMSDRNKDERKRINQALDKNEFTYKNLCRSIEQANLGFQKAAEVFKTFSLTK